MNSLQSTLGLIFACKISFPDPWMLALRLSLFLPPLDSPTPDPHPPTPPPAPCFTPPLRAPSRPPTLCEGPVRLSRTRRALISVYYRDGICDELSPTGQLSPHNSALSGDRRTSICPFIARPCAGSQRKDVYRGPGACDERGAESRVHCTSYRLCGSQGFSIDSAI